MLSGLALAGCASAPRTEPAPTTLRIDRTSLANSPPVFPDAQWRTRIPLGRRPQADHICTLCDNYQLVLIRTPAKWRAFCEQTGLDDTATRPDFSEGIIVGLVARVGEPVDQAWPTAISEIRLGPDGTGWLRSQFRTGLYRPLLVEPYCNLAYVKGLQRVILVEINRRAFLTTQ